MVADTMVALNTVSMLVDTRADAEFRPCLDTSMASGPYSDTEDGLAFGHCSSMTSVSSSASTATERSSRRTTSCTTSSSLLSASSAASYTCIGTTYPADMVVRNTFLDFAVEDDLSASGRQGQKRRSRSEEPRSGRRTGSLEGQEEKESSIVNIGSASSSTDVKFVPSVPCLGSADLPSIGSAGHRHGTCRPCAFFWRPPSSCQNGVFCEYCHMCGPMEKKLRQKQKKLAMKTMQHEQQNLQSQLFESGF